MSNDDLRRRYPSNSMVGSPSEEPGSEKRVTKVTRGRVAKKPQNLGSKFAETFLATDMQSVGNHLLFDVLIPGAKDAFMDMLDMMLNGDRRGDRTRRDKGRSYVYTSYNRYYDDRSRASDSRKDADRGMPRSRSVVEDLVFDSRGDAEEVLSNLVHLIEEYGVASVRDLYGFAGMTSDYTKERYGWYQLDSAHVTRIREGYLLKLPRPGVID